MYYEALLWLALTFTITWIVLFALNPNFVRVVDCDDIYPRPGAPPDPMKCLIFAVIVGLIVSVACIFIFANKANSAQSEFALVRDAALSSGTVAASPNYAPTTTTASKGSLEDAFRSASGL